MSSENFELRLIDALQPIRSLVVAHGTYHLFASGLFEEIGKGTVPISDLAEALSFDPGRLQGFLRFLANEDLVAIRGDCVGVTPRAQALAEFRPWYELLVGGYAETFPQITKALSGESYATRDGTMVGVGSCGISEYDALPLVRGLLAGLSAPPREIVDLGCGDGQFLLDLVKDYPGIQATGVDPFAPVDGDCPDVGFSRSSAVEFVRSMRVGAGDGDTTRCVFVAAFLLHELLQQYGRPTVVQMIHTVLQGGAHLAVVEVEHRPDDPSVMQHGLGLAYYNAYYLIHNLTEQRLETREFWMDVFEDAGAQIEYDDVVNPLVDSTGLEFACLLSAK